MPCFGFARRSLAVPVLAALAVALAPGAAPAGIVTVDVFNNDFGVFNPAAGTGTHFDPTITVGDTIQWVFQQGFHNTQSLTGQADSWQSQPNIAPPVFTFNHTFTIPGDFKYICVIHGTDN